MKITLLIILQIYSLNIFSQDGANRKKHFLLEKGVAINGYDAVSYFSQNPLKGKKTLSYEYGGVKYQFANEANLAAFVKNPAKYEPQYGGWCAYAMGNAGEKVEVDPETYKIINGKLYLFFHTFYKNTLTSWNSDEKALKIKADNNWAKILK
jgi:YHS domain-containing protein